MRRRSASLPIMRSMILSAFLVFLIADVSFVMRMLLWIAAESELPTRGPIYFSVRNFVLLGQGVGKHGHLPPVGKVEYAVLHVTQFRTQLIDLIAEQIGFRPPQLMT